MNYPELLQHVAKKWTDEQLAIANSRILVFDPGHTTGWAFFHHGLLEISGQIETKSIEQAVSTVGELFQSFAPSIVVLEDYRIYKWRQKQHVGSDMLTTRVIGCIETLAIQNFTQQIIKQPAHIAKGFCTDKKLNDWDLWQPGKRHARDAIRHGCYFILFGAVRKEDKGTNQTTIEV